MAGALPQERWCRLIPGGDHMSINIRVNARNSICIPMARTASPAVRVKQRISRIGRLQMRYEVKAVLAGQGTVFLELDADNEDDARLQVMAQGGMVLNVRRRFSGWMPKPEITFSAGALQPGVAFAAGGRAQPGGEHRDAVG